MMEIKDDMGELQIAIEDLKGKTSDAEGQTHYIKH